MQSRVRLALMLVLCWTLPLYAQTGTPDQEQQLAEAGQAALAQGHYAEARDNFERLAKLDPGVAELHATLAVIYYKQRAYELSLREVRTAQKLKPSLPKLDSLEGLSMAELGRFTEALPHLEKGFKQTADAEVKRMCGLQLLRAYTGLKRDSDAVEIALALNKSFPNDPEVLYHTGRIYGNYAYIVMEKLHDESPNSVWMLQAQGEANESQKDYASAIAAFNHVLALDPHRPGIHFRLGRVYLSQFHASQKPEDREAAKREFAAELEGDPGNGNAAYELAQLAAEDNNFDAARRQFEAVLTRFPDFQQALVGLGGVYLQSQQPSLALPPLQRAVKINADDEVAWYRLALAQRATGDRQEAQKSLEVFRKLHALSAASRAPLRSEEVTPQELDANAPQ